MLTNIRKRRASQISNNELSGYFLDSADPATANAYVDPNDQQPLNLDELLKAGVTTVYQAPFFKKQLIVPWQNKAIIYSMADW